MKIDGSAGLKHFGYRYIGLFLAILGLVNVSSYSQTPTGCGEGKVYVCHKGKNTLCVSENAVPAHLAHGDYLGTCVTGNCNVTCTGGEITCANPVVTLSAISNVPEAEYSWIGPDGFTSGQASPAVNVSGEYTVTMTDKSTGCTSAASTTVVSDTAAPDISAHSNGQLTCTNQAITIIGNSSVPGISYKWSGPAGFRSNKQSPVTALAGEYTLVATNPANGCVASTNITIDLDTLSPVNVEAQVSGNLTCAIDEVTLSASSDTPDVLYSWTGPGGFRQENQIIQVRQPGFYFVIYKNNINGCHVRKMVRVLQDISAPADVNASVSGVLTCRKISVILTGTSSAGSAVFSWNGPDGYTSASQTSVVHHGGMYFLTVTSNVNGCSIRDSAFVMQDTVHPGELTVDIPDTINCNNPVIMLDGSSAMTNLQYLWKGPRNFSVSNPQAFANLPGQYTFTATDLLNGCADSAFVTVQIDSSGSNCDSSAMSTVLPFYNNNSSTPAEVTGQINNLISLYADNRKR